MKRAYKLFIIMFVFVLISALSITTVFADQIDVNIDIEKYTNGVDADSPPGPTVMVGDPVVWTYEVTNLGPAPLLDVTVTDDQLGTICVISWMDAGDTVTCTANGTAGAGQYANLGSVSGVSPNGLYWAYDEDPSHYFGEEAPTGFEGCTPGYWKNHLSDWAPTGLDPGDDFDTTFGVDYFSPDITLYKATRLGGGGVKKIARHGTAALLSALHPDVSYPYSSVYVIAAVQAQDVDTLVEANELGCIIP